MLEEFPSYQNKNKEFQRLFHDADFSLYVAYSLVDGVESPYKYLLEYDRNKSADGSSAIIGNSQGYSVGRTDKYLFFFHQEGICEFTKKDLFLKGISKLDKNTRLLIVTSLRAGEFK